MSTNKIRGLSPTHIMGDLVGQYYPVGPFESYRMVRLGHKDYGFNEGVSSGYTALVARYKCSHLEAQRRFKLMLITKRLLK